MLTELAGFTLTRAIPDNVLMGVITGAYKIYGGVIRNNSGAIVAHLVNGFNPLSILTPVGTILNGVNTFQLHRIGRDITQLKASVAALQAATAQVVMLAKGTMLLSGLTLAVSAAGFIFLNQKLSKIDEKLEALWNDVKVIRSFLERQERARLCAALKTLRGVDDSVEENTRISLLVNARQTLGEINEKYRELLVNVSSIEEVLAVEEYYAVTALGHALCSAELDMRKQASNDLKDAHRTWLTTAQRVSCDLIFRDTPERWMQSRYSKRVRTDEIIDWLDFSKSTDRQLEWIDELRGSRSWTPSLTNRLSQREELELEVMRKFVARNRILEGFSSQYDYLAAIEQRPSSVQRYFESFSEEERLDDCLVFAADANLN